MPTIDFNIICLLTIVLDIAMLLGLATSRFGFLRNLFNQKMTPTSQVTEPSSRLQRLADRALRLGRRIAGIEIMVLRVLCLVTIVLDLVWLLGVATSRFGLAAYAILGSVTSETLEGAVIISFIAVWTLTLAIGYLSLRQRHYELAQRYNELARRYDEQVQQA